MNSKRHEKWLGALFLLLLWSDRARAQEAERTNRTMPPPVAIQKPLKGITVLLDASCGNPESIGLVFDSGEERQAYREKGRWIVLDAHLPIDPGKKLHASARLLDGTRRTDCRVGKVESDGDPTYVKATFIFPECSEPLPQVVVEAAYVKRPSGTQRIDLAYSRAVPGWQPNSITCEELAVFTADRPRPINAVWFSVESIDLQFGKKRFQAGATSVYLFPVGRLKGLLSFSRDRQGGTHVGEGDAIGGAKWSDLVLTANTEDIVNALANRPFGKNGSNGPLRELREQTLRDLESVDFRVILPDGQR